MQDIIIYIRAGNVKGKIVDQWNTVLTDNPAILRGLATCLCLRLINSSGNPVSQAELSDYVSWDFVLAGDWDTGTPVEIQVTEPVEVSEATVDGVVYGEIRIPLTAANLNTTELIAALAGSESVTLGAELLGYESGEPDPGFALQFSMAVYNRRTIGGTGSPSEVDDGQYNAAQVDALLDDKLTRDFSTLGTKSAIVDADTLAANNSEDSGNPIVLTFTKLWNWLVGKLFPSAMTIGNLPKCGEGCVLEDSGIAPDNVLLKDGNLADLSNTGTARENLGLGNVENILHNRNAEAAPTVNDDSVAGYSKGSEWIYNNTVYECVDASEGAALWKDMTAAASGGGAGEADVVILSKSYTTRS